MRARSSATSPLNICFRSRFLVTCGFAAYKLVQSKVESKLLA